MNSILTRIETPGWTHAINLQNDADQHLLRLHQTVCTLSIVNHQTSPFKTQKFWLYLEQQNGAHKVIWPTNIVWSQKHVPILSNQKGEIDVFEFVSIDGGVTWFGSFIGSGYKYFVG